MSGKIRLIANCKATVRQGQPKPVANAACKPALRVVDGRAVKVMVTDGVHAMTVVGSSVYLTGIFRPIVRLEVTLVVLRLSRSVIR